MTDRRFKPGDHVRVTHGKGTDHETSYEDTVPAGGMYSVGDGVVESVSVPLPTPTPEREALRARIVELLWPVREEFIGDQVDAVMPVVDELRAEIEQLRDGDPIKAAIKLLRNSGFMVARVPECTKPSGHGRHILITKSSACEGVGPIPHGYHSSHFGTFGTWVNCQCGHSFSDYGEPLSDWAMHKQEHQIEETRR